MPSIRGSLPTPNKSLGVLRGEVEDEGNSPVAVHTPEVSSVQYRAVSEAAIEVIAVNMGDGRVGEPQLFAVADTLIRNMLLALEAYM